MRPAIRVTLHVTFLCFGSILAGIDTAIYHLPPYAGGIAGMGWCVLWSILDPFKVGLRKP